MSATPESPPPPTGLPSFRLANPGDAPCIAVLGMQVFLDTYATEGIRLSLAREVLEHLSPEVIEVMLRTPGNPFLLAEQNAHLVGFAQLRVPAAHEQVPFAIAAELRRLYVQEPFTGRGIGRALLQQAEATVARAGASALWLTAWVGNARAVAFYQRQGYTLAGATRFEFSGASYDNHLFLKDLARTC